MILRAQQINKEPYSAEFLLQRHGEEIGSMFLKGDIRTVWGEMTIDFFGHLYGLSPNGARGIFKKPVNKEYRIFNTFIDGIQTGYICGDEDSEIKEGILNVCVNNKNYTVYSIPCGCNGILYPVYNQDKQIALITQEAYVENNLFNFILHIQDDVNVSLALLILGYIYTCFCYRTGPLETGTFINKQSTENKALVSKVNPTFCKTINA